MADYQNNVDPAAAPGALGASPEAKAGFLNTTTGKLVVGGVILLVVLGAVAAAVFYFLLGGGGNGAVDQSANLAPITSTKGSSTPTEIPVNPAQSSLASTFTFRNIFVPTVKKTYESTATAPGSTSTTDTGSGSTAEVPNVPSNTLFLQSIVSENGEPKARFIWNGQTYTVGENEQVGTSPWKVLKINADSALMLYGDSQVTLSVGQGVGK